MSNPRIIAADALFHVEETFKDWKRAVMDVRNRSPMIKFVKFTDGSPVNASRKQAFEKQDAALAGLKTAIDAAIKSIPDAARCITGEDGPHWHTDLNEFLYTLRAEVNTRGETAVTNDGVRDILDHLHIEQRRLRGMPDGHAEREAMLSPAQLARQFDIPKKTQALKKRLERLRRVNLNCFTEVADRRPKEPQFLYRVKDVLPIIEDLKASHERPA